MKRLKQLQKDYTTTEQSLGLLELGVPMWTADCYIYNYWINGVRIGVYDITPWNNKAWWDGHRNDRYTPCWSVGRLMEIFELCYTDRIEEHVWYNNAGKGNTIVERVMWDFNEKVKRLDFSKLEDRK